MRSHLVCGYMLVLLNKGVGEKVLLDGSLFGKLMPPSQAFQMESPDFQQMFVELAQEGAATAGLNWYRYAWSIVFAILFKLFVRAQRFPFLVPGRECSYMLYNVRRMLFSREDVRLQY
jgi:hypothetical protein